MPADELAITGVPSERRRLASGVVVGAVVALGYFVAAHVGFRLAFVAEQITTVWAPTGIATATLLLYGRRFWPAVWLGAFAANAATTAPLWTAAIIATGNALEAVTAAWVLPRIPGFSHKLGRVSDVVAFVCVAAAGCTAISATIGVTVLCAADVQAWDRFGDLWWNWWFGDALGAVIVAPAILTTVQDAGLRQHGAPTALFVAGAFTVTHLAFGVLPLSPHPLEYIIFPLVIAAAVAGGPSVTSLVVLSASGTAIWHTAHGSGPFAGLAIYDSLILLQVFLGILAATGLLLAAAIAERRHHAAEVERVLERRKLTEAALEQAKLAAEAGQRRLEEANRELARRVLEQQTLLDVLPIGIGIATDRECRQIRMNRAFAETLGLPQSTNASKTAPPGERPTNFRVFTPDGTEVADTDLPLQVSARDGKEVREVELDIVHDDGRVVRLLEYASPLLDEHGVPRGAIGAFVDVTAAHQARIRLMQSEERLRQEVEVRTALAQEAEEANRLKDEFLATLSHELRTPLHAVLGWAHMLREGAMDPAMYQQAIESLERNARAQAQLVEDLLDVSRIMAGKLQIKSDAVDLGAVVTNAVDTVRAGVAAKQLTLHVRVPDQRLVVTGDADRLQQVVWNLVSNAVKFTPTGGHVHVELRQLDAKAEFVVRDTGQGIDPAFRPHLFERFRQMHGSRTRVAGGLGLGLSIVRHLVEAHGGTVDAESDGLGRGATFRVLLPVRAF